VESTDFFCSGAGLGLLGAAHSYKQQTRWLREDQSGPSGNPGDEGWLRMSAQVEACTPHSGWDGREGRAGAE
jgi:hypothetical protein